MKNKNSVWLAYGKNKIQYDFNGNDFEILEPVSSVQTELKKEKITESLDNPIASNRLEDILRTGEKVVIAVPDATRSVGAKEIAAAVLEKLINSGIEKSDIKFLIGGGIHRRPTKQEIEWILGREIPGIYRIELHDANDEANLSEIGVTSRGTRVKLNSNLIKADHVIQIGGISFHYIAGFSGGRKVILPGCAGESTIQQNHKLAFDTRTLEKSRGIASGNLKNNPVHDDMIEAVGFLKPSFAVNTVTNHKNEITGVYAGHWEKSHLRGCHEYLQKNVCGFAAKRPLAIVSVGGFPRDANLTQSHKAMEHAAATLEDDGAMIVVAECADGLGRKDFLDWFAPSGAQGTALKLLDNYKVYGQTVWGIRWKAEKFKVFLISELDPGLVEKMGMTPCRSIEEALGKFGQKTDGFIIPFGLTTLPQNGTKQRRELF
jgi:nickel-dependent lactate racemase